ncbi:transcriptional regulator ATRX homolog isoform X3 [Zophobas morio]|uniref:transcriptional regulator ATRX homolog isoform X3 n=1 Tax=Zophobas morio TaxID=2755281 RepID=UPI003082ED4F
MSKEFLFDVLEKFAQVTSIIVETSKIKDDLDKNLLDEHLKDILERTKAQVENLFEHATSVKEFFDKHEKQEKSADSNTNVGANSSEDSDTLNSGVTTNKDIKSENEEINSTEVQNPKPLIKLVDIKKLVEPRTLIKQDSRKHTKNIELAETVVISSSSEDERATHKTTKTKTTVSKSGIRASANSHISSTHSRSAANVQSTRSPRGIRRKAAEETIKKNKISLQVHSSSDSDSSEDEVLLSKSHRIKNGNTKKATELEKVTLSDTSDNSSDISSVASSRHKKDKQKKDKNVTTQNTSVADWKKDPKFNFNCYVKIVRVPCEKLKEYYLEKLDLLQINKMRDLTALKKKRRRSHSAHSSGNDSKSEKRPKRKHISKPVHKEDTDKSDSDDNVANLEAGNDKGASPAPEPDISSNLAQSKLVEDMAEDALNLLNSDKEDDKEEENATAASDKETPLDASKESDKEKETPDTSNKEKENEKEKQDVPEKDSDKEIVKPNSENVPNEEGDKETAEEQLPLTSNETSEELATPEKKGDEENDKDKDKDNKCDDAKNSTSDKNEDQSEKEADEKDAALNSEEEKENREKSKAKKAWKKDKLLTTKLSSSDSEAEAEKVKKKKEKMQEEGTSDDEPKLPKDKKKSLKKRRKKKAILSDSDSDNKKDSADDFQPESSSSSESEKEEKEKEPEKPKSRKRVKRVRDSSEDDEEKSTRKQIRNIWGRDSLAETTKQAEAEEKERKARIAEKQKKYNLVYEGNSQKNATVDKVVLDFDEKNNVELLKVDDQLVTKLKPHQASGVQFMWDACFESLERAKSTTGSGCILAHCMGLGKTLQVITLAHTLLINNEETKVKKVLVVSPLNTVLNWVNEFKQWLPDNDDFEIFELVSFKQNYERQYQIKTWHNCGGVLIIGYDMFRNLSNPDNKRLSKKMRSAFQEALVDPGPDLVICDEGHLLKNEKTNLSIAMNRIKTLRRIVLTGTPLQNNLKEYFCMVQFIKPNLLGTYKEYLNRFVNPITNGQYTDSTPQDLQIMRKRSHVLHKMLDGVVQRRDYSVLEPYLPPKFEYVIFLKLSETQIKLYQHYMNHFAKRNIDGSNRTSFLFVDFQALQRICAHPRVLLDKSIEMKLAKERMDDSEESEGSLKDFINDEDEDSTSSSSNSGSDSENEGKKETGPRKRLTRAAAALAKENGEEVEDVITVEDPQDKEWWQEYCDGDQLDVIIHSSKLFMLFEILKECEQIGDKVLVFSQSLYSLNVIEYFLEKIHDATQNGDTESVGGYTGSWCLGLDYFRLDGSSSCDSRNTWCKTFNEPSNTRARLFLISTKAGGLGINLVAANRVIIFDVSWNPSHDIQSIYRVYRFGQEKPSYIYRFVTLGTMEMKIYERQVTKQAISKRVIDEQQIDRHYNQNDLAELYKFEPNPGERPIPLVPKDVLLGELLQKFEDRIYKYHEHQSLLENKAEECLNEEERKAAWEEFENEKKQRTNYGSNYVRVSNMELALTSIVRRENPSWTEVQIRAMLPTLHAQMQEQVARGDLSLYKRVQQEIQLLQALQTQRVKDQFYQQQMLRALQQRSVNYTGWVNQFMNQTQMPGTSRTHPAPSGINTGDVIDLND